MEYSGAGGKLIHEKNQKQKFSWHCPFNGALPWNIFGNRNDNSFLYTYLYLLGPIWLPVQQLLLLYVSHSQIAYLSNSSFLYFCQGHLNLSSFSSILAS